MSVKWQHSQKVGSFWEMVFVVSLCDVSQGKFPTSCKFFKNSFQEFTWFFCMVMEL